MCHQTDYGYERYAYHSPWGRLHHQWGCCCVPDYAQRRSFPTREEVIEELEGYLKSL